MKCRVKTTQLSAREMLHLAWLPVSPRLMWVLTMTVPDPLNFIFKILLSRGAVDHTERVSTNHRVTSLGLIGDM